MVCNVGFWGEGGGILGLNEAEILRIVKLIHYKYANLNWLYLELSSSDSGHSKIMGNVIVSATSWSKGISDLTLHI